MSYQDNRVKKGPDCYITCKKPEMLMYFTLDLAVEFFVGAVFKKNSDISLAFVMQLSLN